MGLPTNKLLNTLMKSNKLPKSIICVLGMHRSGTSMLARVLNICGLSLGDSIDVVEQDEKSLKGNETGHWENTKFSFINREILTIFTGSDNWQSNPNFPEYWYKDKRLSDTRLKAKKLIKEFDNKYQIWGWKDPRTCLTLPFWQNLLIDRLVFIIPIRDPVDTSTSLYKRNGIDPETGKHLWSIYNEKIVEYTEGHKRIFIEIEKFYNNPIDETKVLIKQLNVKGIALTSKRALTIKKFVNLKLWHNRNFNKTVLSKPTSYIETNFYKLYLFHLFTLAKSKLANIQQLRDMTKENSRLQKEIHSLNLRHTQLKSNFKTYKSIHEKENKQKEHHIFELQEKINTIIDSKYFVFYSLYEKLKSIIKLITHNNEK